MALDAQRRIIAWNGGAEQLLGYMAQTVLGSDCRDVLFADRLEARTLEEQWITTICSAAGPLPQHCRELAVCTAGGEIKWILLSALPAWTAERSRITICLLHETTHYHHVMSDATMDEADAMPQLTAREVEVLTLLGCGLPTREIARSLGISGVTARNHVAHIMEKLGAASRLQAVVIASRLRLM